MGDVLPVFKRPVDAWKPLCVQSFLQDARVCLKKRWRWFLNPQNRPAALDRVHPRLRERWEEVRKTHFRYLRLVVEFYNQLFARGDGAVLACMDAEAVYMLCQLHYSLAKHLDYLAHFVDYVQTVDKELRENRPTHTAYCCRCCRLILLRYTRGRIETHDCEQCKDACPVLKYEEE